ncbi:MAG TPA: hypothetical protein VGY66_02930 [Gemmataceae bacterium]|nr:hypothetical protein [Gemmataceae bacterium]
MTQIHDFDPGFGPAVSSVGGNGFGDRTFWTVAIPDSAVHVNFGAGRAEMQVSNLAMDDYGKIPTALGPQWQTAFDPATVSFDVVWSGPVSRRLSVTNGSNGDQFAGDYVEDQATVTWSGTNNATGFSFTANPGDFSTSAPGRAFAELGHEGNGTFFSSDSSGPMGSSFRLPARTPAIWVALPPRALPPTGSSSGLGKLSVAVFAGMSGNPPASPQGFLAAAKPPAGNLVIPAPVTDQLFTNLAAALSFNAWANDLALAHQK